MKPPCSASFSSSPPSSPPSLRPPVPHRPRRTPLLSLTALVLLALPLLLLHPSPRRALALAHIRFAPPQTSARPACRVLYLHIHRHRHQNQHTHDTTPPPLGSCCATILTSPTATRRPNSTTPTVCQTLHLSNNDNDNNNNPIQSLTHAFAQLQTTHDFAWLHLPPPASSSLSRNATICHTALLSALADVDHAAIVRAGVPLSTASAPHPNTTQPPQTYLHHRHQPPPPQHPPFNPAFPVLLSSALVTRLASTHPPTLHDLPAEPYPNDIPSLLDRWLVRIRVQTHTLVLSTIPFDTLRTLRNDTLDQLHPQQQNQCPFLPNIPPVITSTLPHISLPPSCTRIAASNSPPCPSASSATAPTLRDITFLILPQNEQQSDSSTATTTNNNTLTLYNTLRALFPYSPLIFPSSAHLRTTNDPLLHLHTSQSNPATPALRNILVSLANTPYILFLTDLHLPTLSRTRIALMLRQVASANAHIAGGYLIRPSEHAYQGRLSNQLLATEEPVGFRYGFTDEMTLRREPVTLAQLQGRDCFRAHRTSDFMLAERDTLLRHQWRPQFGSLAHDEFFVRLMRKELKVAVCDSGVLHRFHDPPTQKDRVLLDWDVIKMEASRLCRVWDQELGDIGGLAMRGLEFDCAKKRVCERTEIPGGDGTQFEKKWTCQSWD